MATAYHHSLSSVKRWGGKIEDYIQIHTWMDASKELHGDFRHRALRHHTQGVFECERQFGHTIINASNRVVPVRSIAEMHVIEDLGRLPSLGEWLMHIQPQPWMSRTTKIEAELVPLEVQLAAERLADKEDKDTQLEDHDKELVSH